MASFETACPRWLRPSGVTDAGSVGYGLAASATGGSTDAGNVGYGLAAPTLAASATAGSVGYVRP